MNGDILTMGTFDLLHPGHIKLLEDASTLSYGNLIVTVNTDDFVARFKRQPIMSLEERMTMIRSIWCVHEVYPNSGGESQKDLINYVKPSIIAIGMDWKDRDYLGQICVTQDWLDERDIKIEYLELLPGISTTRLIERCVQAKAVEVAETFRYRTR